MFLPRLPFLHCRPAGLIVIFNHLEMRGQQRAYRKAGSHRGGQRRGGGCGSASVGLRRSSVVSFRSSEQACNRWRGCKPSERACDDSAAMPCQPTAKLIPRPIFMRHPPPPAHEAVTNSDVRFAMKDSFLRREQREEREEIDRRINMS